MSIIITEQKIDEIAKQFGYPKTKYSVTDIQGLSENDKRLFLKTGFVNGEVISSGTTKSTDEFRIKKNENNIINLNSDVNSLKNVSSVTAATNGISFSERKVGLGGTLTGTTQISLDNTTLIMGNRGWYDSSDFVGSCNSIVTGYASYSLGCGHFVNGYNSKAFGKYAHAEGYFSTACGYFSHSEGGGRAYGNKSHAEGEGTANGEYSHAEGFAVACGKNSHAEGRGTAIADFSHAEGRGRTVGKYSHAEGCGTCAIGDYSHAEGRLTKACGKNSHAEGCGTIATGNYSHAEGCGTIAIGNYSHAEGRGGYACGNYSHIEGFLNCALANYSHAEGCQSKSCAIGSHAQGYWAITRGDFSHAEGAGFAQGNFSHAEAYGVTTAAATYAHAEGYGRAQAIHSHAQGNCTRAGGDSSHAGGKGANGRPIIAQGIASFNHSHNTGSQTLSHGALADFSVILGGRNHNIESGNTGATIIGGDTIKLTGNTYINTTAVGNLAIIDTPAAGGSEDVLTWNPTTNKINKVTQVSISDENLKTNLMPLTNVTSKLIKLNTYEYEFNDNVEPKSLIGEKKYGLIAQEVEKDFPLVVKETIEFNGVKYKGVNYKELVPVLIESIKELNKRITLLEK